MTESLNISLHGTQRVEIIERLVHICRYSPGLVFLDGEPGKSPVSFLRHMADLLRDELDFALLDSAHARLAQLCDALMAQWFVYRADGDGQTDSQRIHHFLDVGAQGGRMALVVVERTQLLDDDSLNFLIGLMARHAQLTVLFAGVADTRPLLRRAQQAEVPVHRIELPENGYKHAGDGCEGADVYPGVQSEERSSRDSMRPTARQAGTMVGEGVTGRLSSQGSDDLFAQDDLDFNLAASRRGDSFSTAFTADRSHAMGRTARLEPTLGISTRLTDLQAWGTATFAGLRRRKWVGPTLIFSVAFLSALLVVAALYYRPDSHLDVTAASSYGERVAVVSIAGNSGAAVAVSPSPAVVGSPGVADIENVKRAQPVLDSSAVAGGALQGGALAPAVTTSSSTTPPSVPTPPSPSPSLANIEEPVRKPEPALPEKPAPVVTKKPVVAAKAEAREVSLTEKQWRAHPEYFTVQLAAAYGEPAIKALAARLPADKPHFVYRGSREGRPWFVLVYGSFASRSEAVAAKSRLVVMLKGQAEPWVRKQGEVFVR